eukprot:scaffold1272_cov250-Pinguiococcus_pyrenoidosus.AAC.37
METRTHGGLVGRPSDGNKIGSDVSERGGDWRGKSTGIGAAQDARGKTCARRPRSGFHSGIQARAAESGIH